jgi:ketosteroid isomerase-like protein
MDIDDAERFAQEWVAGWNSHDLDRILAHYADDVVFRSPVAERLMGTGVLRGRAALREYWAEGLRRVPNLRFEVVAVRSSVDAVVIDYRNQDGGLVAEVLRFDGDRIVEGFGAYGRP